MSPYAAVSDHTLDQGIIIDDCPVVSVELPTGTQSYGPPKVTESRVIVLTQSCDLANIKTDRVVVAAVHTAQVAVQEGYVKASTVRDQIAQHKMFGWYFLPSADDPVVFPESLVDLRDLHTVPKVVLERLLAAGKGVARLIPPYREHLAQHFAVTYMRIALQYPYRSE